MELNISRWSFVPFWDCWGELHCGRAISILGAKHHLADQPNCCLNFRWLKFDLIHSPPSSFNLDMRKAHGGRVSPWSQKLPTPYQISREVATMEFPALLLLVEDFIFLFHQVLKSAFSGRQLHPGPDHHTVT